MASGEAPISIAIIGAGIGGLALAMGLLKQNIHYTVYEVAPRFEAVGAGIRLGPNALRAMDLTEERFATIYNEVKVGNTSLERLHEQFEILSIRDGFGISEEWKGGRVGHPEFERSSAHRKDLLEIMKSLIPSGVVQFSRRVVQVSQTRPSSKVLIEFQDGKTVADDFVVGCDGIKGVSRRAVLESRYPEEVPAKYLHTYVYRGICSLEEATKCVGTFAEDARWWMGEGKGWTMYPISRGKEVNIVAFMHDPNPWKGEQIKREVAFKEMQAEFREFDQRLQDMLVFVKSQKWPLFHHPDTPTYYKGRICLLGDSAHASSPSQAAGVGQGLEDALILSRLLSLVRRPEEIDNAVQVYDAIRRPRVQALVRESEQVGLTYFFMHPDFGHDIRKIVGDANRRLPLIWWHDLDLYLERAQDTFKSLLQARQEEPKK